MILADSKNDGIVMFYSKNSTAYPIVLTEEQRQMLNTLIPMALNGKLIVVQDRPIFEVEWEKMK